jgi:transposase InsO family protein
LLPINSRQSRDRSRQTRFLRKAEAGGTASPHAYGDLWQARKGISSYIDYYNRERRHSSLEKQTPEQAYQQTPLLPPPPPLAVRSLTAQLSS